MAYCLAAALCAIPLLGQTQEHCMPPNANADYILGEVAGEPAAVHWITGLVWQRCMRGQSWNAATSTCTGAPATATWVDWANSPGQALLPHTFSGQDDWNLTPEATFAQDLLNSGAWRMPYHKELVHLAVNCTPHLQINPTVFPGTPTALQWTGSPSNHMAGDPYASLIGFDSLTEAATVVTAPNPLRTVRGGQPFAPLATTPYQHHAAAAGQTIAFAAITLDARSGAGQAWGGVRIAGAGNPAFQINGAGPWVQEAIVKSGDQLAVRMDSPALAGTHTAELTLHSSEGFPTQDLGINRGQEDHYPHSTTAVFSISLAAGPSGATAVPGLGVWALALLMLACSGLGLRAARSRRRE